MRHHVLPAIVALAAIVGFTACQDVSSPTPPPAAAVRGISPSVTASLSKSGSAVVQVLERDKPVKDGVSASANIGVWGGVIALPDAGFTLVVPFGAVRTTTHFTVTAVPGKLVAYEFEPHGTTFPIPLWAFQDLKPTKASSGGGNGKVSVSSLFVGYVGNGDLNTAAGLANIREAITLSIDDKAQMAVFPISHFSAYAVGY
jgi:hypothetical protein